MNKSSFINAILVIMFLFSFSAGCTVKSVENKAAVSTDAKSQMTDIPAIGAAVSTETTAPQITVKNDNNDHSKDSYNNSVKKTSSAIKPTDTQNRILQAGKGEENLNLNIENLKCIKDSQQFILVSSDSLKSTSATVYTYEKINGKWNEKLSPFKANVGRKGFTYEKAEGDEKSPIGAFDLKKCYGRLENPGTKLDFIHFGENSFWVDDSSSKYYNTFQNGPSDGRWSSAENLYKIGDIYKYFILVEYNTAKRTPGKGSAIFMHIMDTNKVGTSGCTSMSEEKLLKLLKWLDPEKKPKLLQGPSSEINKM